MISLHSELSSPFADSIVDAHKRSDDAAILRKSALYVGATNTRPSNRYTVIVIAGVFRMLRISCV